MKAIKSIYDFVMLVQLLCMIIFIFYFIENNYSIIIPIQLEFTIPVPVLDDINYTFNYDFVFSLPAMITMIIAMFAVFIISTITAVGSGVNTEGTVSLKQIVGFIAKFFIMQLPVTFLLSQSAFLIDYTVMVGVILFIVYLIDFISSIQNSGSEYA